MGSAATWLSPSAGNRLEGPLWAAEVLGKGLEGPFWAAEVLGKGLEGLFWAAEVLGKGVEGSFWAAEVLGKGLEGPFWAAEVLGKGLEGPFWAAEVLGKGVEGSFWAAEVLGKGVEGSFGALLVPPSAAGRACAGTCRGLPHGAERPSQALPVPRGRSRFSAHAPPGRQGWSGRQVEGVPAFPGARAGSGSVGTGSGSAGGAFGRPRVGLTVCRSAVNRSRSAGSWRKRYVPAALTSE